MRQNRVAIALLCAILGLIAVGCAPLTYVQEPNRIVLLAPFEGLYRRSGYSALEAMRSVTELSTLEVPSDRNSRQIAWTPVAIDTSRDPLRAAQKALAPQNATAIAGPLTPSDAALVFPALQKSGVDWYAPFAATESGFTTPNDPAWLASLIAGVASSAQANSAQSRILIAGWEAFSTITPKDALASDTLVPVVWLDAAAADFETLPGDTLLWLGDAAEGVRYIAAARAQHPDLAVFLPYWAAGDVFVEHASALDNWSWDGIEWGARVGRPEEGATLTPAIAEWALVAAATNAAQGVNLSGIEFYSTPLLPQTVSN